MASASKGRMERLNHVKSAPPYLVTAYHERKIGVGRQLLKQLLEDSSMKRAWSELAREVSAKGKPEQHWWHHAVWTPIVYAKRKSNETKDGKTRKTRGKERDDYNKFAEQFALLAKEIENGPLDVPAHNLLDGETLAALHDADTLQHVYAPELLSGMARLSRTLAAEAMTKPRPDERNKGRTDKRVFIWHLGNDFRAVFGKELRGTVARITDVVFGNPEGTTTPSFVRDCLKKGCD